MDKSILVIEDILRFLEQEDKLQASTEKINKYFSKLGYTKGQIAGVLHRGIGNKVLDKPFRAVYRIADMNKLAQDKSVLDVLKDKITMLYNELEKISYMSYEQMDDADKQEFNMLVLEIQELHNRVNGNEREEL